MHKADRLFGAAAIRPGNARDRHREIDRRMRERAFRHRFRGFAADRAMCVERCRRNAEHLLLGLIAVGDEAAVEHAGDAGNFGQRSGDQTAGAGFGRRDRQLLAPADIEQLFRGGDNIVIQHR